MTALDDVRYSERHLGARAGNELLPVIEQTTSWQRSYVRWVFVLDLAAATVACVAALLVRFSGGLSANYPYVLLSIALPLAWVLSVSCFRAYEMRFLGVGPEEFRRIVNAGPCLLAAIALASYVSKAEIARLYVFLALPLAVLLTLAGRHAARRWLYRARREGRCVHRVLLVGHEQGVLASLATMRRDVAAGMDVVGACLPRGVQTPALVRDKVAVVGDFTSVVQAVEYTGADTVAVLACPELDGPTLRRLAWELEKTKTDLLVAPAAMDVAGPRIHIRPVSGLPLLHVEEPELTGGRRVLKSVVDRFAAGLALLVLAPVLLTLAVAVRSTSEGPAFFKQRRVGRHGHEFTMLKFRTMVQGAESAKTDLDALNESDGGVLFKMRNDPRVTKVGGFLRRYSLDELPQLVNVLLGHMSLVGPRPPLAVEVARYDEDMRARRMLVKPGLTGLWQINGRSDLSWDEAVRLDLRYVENWSLALDFSILARTVSAVIRSSGAY